MMLIDEHSYLKSLNPPLIVAHYEDSQESHMAPRVQDSPTRPAPKTKYKFSNFTKKTTPIFLRNPHNKGLRTCERGNLNSESKNVTNLLRSSTLSANMVLLINLPNPGSFQRWT